MRLRQFEPFVIADYEADKAPYPRHTHNYFEIIYIYKGYGEHSLNKGSFTYSSGDIFLLTPGDCHQMTVKKRTRFVYLKFKEGYFHHPLLHPDTFTTQVEPVMRNSLLRETKLQLTRQDKAVLKKTIDIILSEYQTAGTEPSVVIPYQLLTIIALAKKQLQKTMTPQQAIATGGEVDEQLLSFIHRHIYTPERLQIKSIAGNFNIAASYFGAYFKRRFGIGYKAYVDDYRLSLIVQRVQHGQQKLKNIAAEFGLVDASHLSKLFKEQKNASPRQFGRKKGMS